MLISDVKYLNLLGERGGTRTLDPMIKSHVLYRLSYALTHLSICPERYGEAAPVRIIL